VHVFVVAVLHLKALRDNDTAEITLPETEGIVFDIGDIVGATEVRSGIKVTETVTQKIIRIKSGIITAEYNTGGSAANTSVGETGSGGGTGGGTGDADGKDGVGIKRITIVGV
jgi:hypothetical protein